MCAPAHMCFSLCVCVRAKQRPQRPVVIEALTTPGRYPPTHPTSSTTEPILRPHHPFFLLLLLPTKPIQGPNQCRIMCYLLNNQKGIIGPAG